MASSLALLSPQAKVWIYVASRRLSPEEMAWIQARAQAFLAQWQAHGAPLRAALEVREGYFLFLAVDESQTVASGCSIDRSVAFIRELGQALDVDFFDRMRFAYRDARGSVQVLDSQAFSQAYAQGKLNTKTKVFNPLCQTLQDLEQGWELELEQSWHKNFI